VDRRVWDMRMIEGEKHKSAQVTLNEIHDIP
jgi:hypothetical protein